MTPNELGRINFETWFAWRNGRCEPEKKNTFSNDAWDDLSPNEQQAYTKAAMTVGAHVAEDLAALGDLSFPPIQR